LAASLTLVLGLSIWAALDFQQAPVTQVENIAMSYSMNQSQTATEYSPSTEDYEALDWFMQLGTGNTESELF